MTGKREEEKVKDEKEKAEDSKDNDDHMDLNQLDDILRKFVKLSNAGKSLNQLQFNLPVGIKLYSAPRARQSWGDKQSLPHVNWGDIFFDLFYVAAAYNLAGIVKYSPTWYGFLYFVGCFGPVVLVWETKTMYDATFVIDDNIYHRFLEVAHYCLTASAVLHIRPLEELSKPYDHRDMFVFCLAVTLGLALNSLKLLEVYLRGVGDRAAMKQAAVISSRWSAISICCFFAASIVAGVTYYENDTHSNLNSTNHIPISLCIAGWLGNILYGIFFSTVTMHQKNVGLPLNIEYVIHRYGEWTMLMLGESILSLLIVETGDVEEYYVSFYGGLLSVILLQYLHFRSEPHHADDHAMRRSKGAGIKHVYLMNVYSASLILLGNSYKMLLTEFSVKNYNRLLSESNAISQHARLLAGSYFSTEERRKRTAVYFCVSIAVTWISLDLMSINHKGMESNCKRCQCEIKKHVRVLPVLFVLCRLIIILFMISLFKFTTDPDHLILSAFVCIIVQLCLRCAGDYVFPDNKVVNHHDAQDTSSKDMQKTEALRKMSILIQENFDLDEIETDPEENRWPNTTYGTVEKSKQ